MFNVPDDGDYKQARAFLLPFRALLVAAGAFEFRRVNAPELDASPAEDELAGLRAAFDGLRTSKLLTDVVFRAPALSAGTHDESGQLWAHRALLATASEYFHTLFSDGFMESGPASVQNPIALEMESVQELGCAALILGEAPFCQYLPRGSRMIIADHVYTGHFHVPETREDLVRLLYLSHRWQITQVLAKAEIALVKTIDPWSYQDCTYYALLWTR